nr:E66 [uncultured bacterium]
MQLFLHWFLLFCIVAFDFCFACLLCFDCFFLDILLAAILLSFIMLSLILLSDCMVCELCCALSGTMVEPTNKVTTKIGVIKFRINILTSSFHDW